MQKDESEFSFRSLFLPFTTSKALHTLIILGILVLGNGLFNGFVSDDNTIVLNNPAVHQVSYIPKLFFENKYDSNGQTFLGGRYYRPITDSFFALNYGFFGPNAFPFHLFQILLYIVTACLLYLLLKHFFPRPLAFALSSIFLVHPINSENAFYISSVQEVLFLFFGILAFLCVSKTDSRKGLIATSLCLLLSLFSKETGILFFITLPLYVFLYKKKLLLPLLGYSAVAFFMYGILRLAVLGNPVEVGAHSPMERAELTIRLLNVPSIILYYLKTFFYPMDLATSYQWLSPHINGLDLVLDVFFFLILVGVGVSMYRRKSLTNFKAYCFFSVWFILGLLIHLQIFPLDQTVAERWFYFPIVGLLGMSGLVLQELKIKIDARWAIMLFVVLITILAGRVFIRSLDFRNDGTLVRSDIQVSRDSYSLEYIMSGVYLNEGRLDLARIHAEKSTKLFPTLANYNNLGVVYMQMGEYTLARSAFLSSLQYGEDYLPYDNIANVALVSGNPKNNITVLRTAVKKYPESGNIWLTLAILEYKYGDKHSAQQAIQQAVQYSNAPQIPFIKDVIANNQPLHMTITNGQVKFDTTTSENALKQ